MSTTRELITAALSAVPGVDARMVPPARAYTPGQAWPEWASLTRVGFCTGQDTWHVMYVLAQADWESVVDGTDADTGLIFAALETVGTVGICEPVSLTTGDSILMCLRFTVTTSREL